MKVLIIVAIICYWQVADSVKWCSRLRRTCDKGHELDKQMKFSNVADCMAQCEKTKDCEAVVYDDDKICSLRDYICLDTEQKIEPSHDFYYAIDDEASCDYQYCQRDGKGCPGNEFGASAVSFSDCRTKCTNSPACKAFTYHLDIEGSNCFLKNKVCKSGDLVDRKRTKGSYFVKQPRGQAFCSDFLKLFD